MRLIDNLKNVQKLKLPVVVVLVDEMEKTRVLVQKSFFYKSEFYQTDQMKCFVVNKPQYLEKTQK